MGGERKKYRKDDDRTKTSLPGMNHLNKLVRGYTGAWERHYKAVNQVWGDVTSADAGLSSFTSGISKIFQTWSDSACDLASLGYGGFGSQLDPNPRTLIFVLDRVAESSGEPQKIPLADDVDGSDVKVTSLAAVDGGAPLPATILSIDATASKGYVEVSVVGLVAHRPLLGHYVAIVYVDSPTPPKSALATLHLVFTP